MTLRDVVALASEALRQITIFNERLDRMFVELGADGILREERK